jgi:beta-galactosidase
MKIQIFSYLRIIILFLGCFLVLTGNAPSPGNSLKPGQIWNDTDGNPINAHGGGILYDKGIYYWFGEIKKGKTWRVPYITSWECYRAKAEGVSCYSSKDLYHWKYEGVALAPNQTDSTSDIHTSKVIERPKVIYNEKTKKYVMWVHIDSEDYSYASAGVAISDKPQGPYTYLGSFRPNGQMSRDQTLFKDTDGKAYQICSSENNATMYINELSDDYLQPTGNFKRIFIGLSREAPALVKHNRQYYILSSGCTGWDPNAAAIAVSSSVLGDYKILGNPCLGKDGDKTYYAQSTFILPVEGKSDTYIAMFDKWNKTNLEDSRYIWLPMHFIAEKAVVDWKDEWAY